MAAALIDERVVERLLCEAARAAFASAVYRVFFIGEDPPVDIAVSFVKIEECSFDYENKRREADEQDEAAFELTALLVTPEAVTQSDAYAIATLSSSFRSAMVGASLTSANGQHLVEPLGFTSRAVSPPEDAPRMRIRQVTLTGHVTRHTGTTLEGTAA